MDTFSGDILTVHERLDELEKPLQKNTGKLQGKNQFLKKAYAMSAQIFVNIEILPHLCERLTVSFSGDFLLPIVPRPLVVRLVISQFF